MKIGTNPTTGTPCVWVENPDRPASRFNIPDGIASIDQHIARERARGKHHVVDQLLDARLVLAAQEATS